MLKSKHLFLFAILVSMCIPFTYGGCNGGGGGGSGGGDTTTAARNTAPVVSSAALFKIVDGDEIQTLTFTVGDRSNVEIIAIDPDLDMEMAFIEQFLLPNIDVPFFPTTELILPSQSAAQMLYFFIEDAVVEGPVGDWRICFWIVDGAGAESNEFCLNIVVNAAEAMSISGFEAVAASMFSDMEVDEVPFD